ncbi:AbrB/MazE/SpoVT family DNA-binding domain-containing protein [Halosimplex marinum]|uniref:AbrB/MazE/SpoVT family DNA-binding domain-containing protein n=1 Tax=Halosimplex marinum TaxID=3396620 RepID=UPI003F575EEB
MPEATLDDTGRLTLPEETRERYGDRYWVVELHDGIKLVPVADDPLDALKEEFADVDEPAGELRDRARKEGLDGVGR